jgi:hypothetical protein
MIALLGTSVNTTLPMSMVQPEPMVVPCRIELMLPDSQPTPTRTFPATHMPGFGEQQSAMVQSWLTWLPRLSDGVALIGPSLVRLGV